MARSCDSIENQDLCYIAFTDHRPPIARPTRMSQSPRILNLSRKFHLKPSQAQRAIENCSAEWVEENMSIRDLTLAESIEKRNQQAKQREPLPQAEIPGLMYHQPASAALSAHERAELVRAANALCMVM